MNCAIAARKSRGRSCCTGLADALIDKQQEAFLLVSSFFSQAPSSNTSIDPLTVCYFEGSTFSALAPCSCCRTFALQRSCSSPSRVALIMFSSSIFLVFRFAFSEMYFRVDQIPIHRKSCRKDKAGHVIILPLCTLDTCSDSTRRSDNLKGHLPTLCSGYIYRTLQWPLVGPSFDPQRQTCRLLLQERRLACRLLVRQIVHM